MMAGSRTTGSLSALSWRINGFSKCRGPVSVPHIKRAESQVRQSNYDDEVRVEDSGWELSRMHADKGVTVGDCDSLSTIWIAFP